MGSAFVEQFLIDLMPAEENEEVEDILHLLSRESKIIRSNSVFYFILFLTALPFELRILSEEQSQYSDGYLLEWQVGSVPPLIECNLRVEEVRSVIFLIYMKSKVYSEVECLRATRAF